VAAGLAVGALRRVSFSVVFGSSVLAFLAVKLVLRGGASTRAADIRITEFGSGCRDVVPLVLGAALDAEEGAAFLANGAATPCWIAALAHRRRPGTFGR
jgi:hypothetical protein